MRVNPFVGSAPWMTPEMFVPGGAIEQQTNEFLRVHGARCHAIWVKSLVSFANGRPLSPAVIQEHARESLANWAMSRAAAYVTAGNLQKPASQKTGAKTGKPTGKAAADIRRAFGWGSR